MENKSLSIIIPFYNGKEFITQTIDSIKKIKHSKEIIIVDDGSKEEERLFCNHAFCGDDDVKIYYKENGGIVSARNFGLEIANGDYILFVDQDDVVISEIIDKAIDLASQEILDLVFWSTAKLYENGEVIIYGQVQEDFILNGKSETETLIREMLFNLQNKKISYIGCVWSALFRLSKVRSHNIKFKKFIDFEDDYLFVFDAINKFDKIAAITDIGYYWRCNLKSESNRFKHISGFIDKSIAFYTYLFNESKHFLDDEIIKEYEIYVKQKLIIKSIENCFMCIDFSAEEANKCKKLVKAKENSWVIKIPLMYPYTKRPKRIYKLLRKNLNFLAYAYVYLDSVYRVIKKKIKH